MNSIKRGKIIVIVAPSGTGKSTLIEKLRAEYPQVQESISFTTRPMRKGEEDGKNYFFIEKEEFIEKRDQGEFLEWAEVHTNFYGTSKRYVEKSLEEGKIVLFDLDVQGCDSMKEAFPESHVIFIEPPSIEELERRLRGRGTETTDIIDVRLGNAKKELGRKNDFDYLIQNDEFDTSYDSLKKIVKEILEV